MEERWRFVPGYQMYDVSDLGNVRSWRGGGGSMATEPHPLRGSVTPQGYRNVTLYGENGKKTIFVHRLVLLAFVGPSKLGACHADDNPLNNRLTNLAYGTAAANSADAVRRGRLATNERHYRAKYTDAQIAEVRRLRMEGVPRPTVAAMFGMHPQYVTQITAGAVRKAPFVYQPG